MLSFCASRRASFASLLPEAALLIVSCGGASNPDTGASVRQDGGLTSSSSGGEDGSTVSSSGAFFGDGKLGCAAHNEGCPCSSPGGTIPCWTGPASLRGVGACRDGTQTCQQTGEFGQWGRCQGQRLDCGDAGGDASDASDGSGGLEGGAVSEDSGLPNPLSGSCRRLAMSSLPHYDEMPIMADSYPTACVIASDGTVKCAAEPPNADTAVTTIANSSGARCISGGEGLVCLVTRTGGVACFGMGNNNPTAAPVPGLESGVIDVAVGELHVCVLLSTGTVQCWGGGWGEWNTGNGSWPVSPTTVALGSSATAITSGDGFSCAILASTGNVECWGKNQHGELGSDAASPGTTPVQVMGLPAAAVGIWADQATSPCALLKDGSVWCWGTTHNTLNLYDNLPTSAPAPQTGFSAPVQSLTAGGEWGMSCALLTTGAVQCWGLASVYLGDNGNVGLVEGEYSAQPVDVLPAGSGVVEIRSNDEGACALLADGGVTCWGKVRVPTMLPGL
jgi:Regulator of chromosome condensation (RCC1) repeat